MPKRHTPRSGSMQFWPRKRAKRMYPRVRNVGTGDAKPLFFAGYKAGMTHGIITDNKKNSITKGESVAVPLTVIECPALLPVALRCYKTSETGAKIVAEELPLARPDHLKRKLALGKSKPKTADLSSISPSDFHSFSLLVATQPNLVGKKKTPELFELPIGGSIEEQFNFVKENGTKPISVADVFAEGDFIDVKAVTKGKGFQGPVKRFGINLRAKKSEKTKRGPGSLGPWKGQAHIMYRVPHAGQMGFHQRTEYHKHILRISDDVTKINPEGGFIRYGNVKSTYVLVKGSVPGPKKRLVALTKPIRGETKEQAPELSFVSLVSKQR